MPTQAELDAQQERTESSSTTIGTVRRGGIYDIDTQPNKNKQGTDERIANDGIDDISNEASSSELSRYEPLEITLVVNGQSLYTTEILTTELIPVP